MQLEQMMTDKQLNRAVRAVPLVYEALSSLWLSAFFEWCRENDILTALKDKLSPVLSQVILSFRDKQCPSTYLDNYIAILKEFLAPPLEEFRQWGCGASPTFKYWDMFLRAVEIMLQNVRSKRKRIWKMHLTSTASMLLYMFITNKVNYFRWLPVCLLDMNF
jgi:hypothetical protein